MFLWLVLPFLLLVYFICLPFVQIQFVPYLCQRSLFSAFCLALFGIMFTIMTKFNFTRSLLLKVNSFLRYHICVYVNVDGFMLYKYILCSLLHLQKMHMGSFGTG